MKTSRLYRLMSRELPTITEQKRLSYRTDEAEVRYLFRLINKEVFNNELPIPTFQVVPRCRDYWGLCEAKHFEPNPDTPRSDCIIRLSDKWFCKQWLITTLAHEMCHQYQWDVYSKKRVEKGLEPIMSHGPSFFQFKTKLARHGIPLRLGSSKRLWFKHQNLFKC